MTELLLRLFVKNYQDTGNPAVHSAVGILAGVTGIVCNCLLFLGKLIVGLLVGVPVFVVIYDLLKKLIYKTVMEHSEFSETTKKNIKILFEC